MKGPSHISTANGATAIACAALAWLLALAALTTAAQAATSATIAPSLHPDKAHALSSLTMTAHYYTSGESAVPEPIRRAILRFPAGMSVEIPALRSCTAKHLRTFGARGCPAGSQLGSGHALAEVQAGSQTMTEDIALSVFLGPLRNLQPTVEVLAQGYTPFDERVVFTGTMLPDIAPYGERLVMSIPAIHSLPLEPDASIVDLSLTVGASHRHAQITSAVVVPSDCPAGGFPFAAEFTYADGSSGSAQASTPCPT
jgi:hypothetical protein